MENLRPIPEMPIGAHADGYREAAATFALAVAIDNLSKAGLALAGAIQQGLAPAIRRLADREDIVL